MHKEPPKQPLTPATETTSQYPAPAKKPTSQPPAPSKKPTSQPPSSVTEPTQPPSPTTQPTTSPRIVGKVKRVRKRSKVCSYVICISQLFSQLFLFLLVVGYTFLGGFIFQMLEMEHDVKQRTNVDDARSASVDELRNMTEELYDLDNETWTLRASEILKRFQDDVYKAAEEDWDGDTMETGTKWTFAGSLLYSVTVMTTVGYSDVSPKTGTGQFVTILYALVGIPLTIVCLSSIGSSFARWFRFLYYKPLKYVGYPPRGYKYDMTIIEDVVSLDVVSLDRKEYTAHTDSSSVDQTRPDDAASINSGPNNVQHILYTLNTSKVRVPLTISLMIIVLYILTGAALFSSWDQDLTLSAAAYFCFMTLTTIGFGDYEVGQGSDVDEFEKSLVTAIYLLFGFAIIAMCFDLMQKELRAKVTRVAEKLGIIDVDDDLIANTQIIQT